MELNPLPIILVGFFLSYSSVIIMFNLLRKQLPQQQSKEPYENGEVIANTSMSDGTSRVERPIYSIGLERVMEKGKIKNPYSIGPSCIAIPDGIYTQAVPLDVPFMNYVNPRLDAYVDKMFVLGQNFTLWANAGFRIKKNGDYWIPNLMSAITIMPENQVGNWINPPPLWSNMIGYDVKIRTGDNLRIELYNESGSLGYVWLFVVGHYELMEEGEI
jgi:hypothetical protein